TEVLTSATSLVANLRWVFSDHVDYEGIGRYHVELFTRSLDRLVDTDLTGPVSHTYYPDLLQRPLDTVADVYSALGLAWSDELRDTMAAHLADQPQGRHGEHRYDFDDLGVDRATVDAGFARYVEAFHVPRRSVDHDDS